MKKIILFITVLSFSIGVKANEVSVFDAARNNQVNILEQYVKAGNNIDTLNNAGHSLLILAVYSNNFEATKYLIEHKANLNIQDKSGNSALMGAAFRGYKDIAELLLINKANPNLLNFNKANALFFAATFGHAAIAELLLKYKVDRNQKDKFGKTALDYAINQENDQMILLLKN